jgi:predicted HTH transcriptional regulator
MNKYKIFVSGVQKELKAERQVMKDFILGDVLLSEYFDVFLFEDCPARSRSAEKAYLDEVNKSKIYIGILGSQYGNVGKSGISPTEVEFREAKAKHKEILFYIKGDSITDKNRDIGVHKLIGEIKDPKAGYSYRRFNTTKELTDRVYESLISFLKERGEVGRDNFDQRICEGATFSDIDNKIVQQFLKTARNKRNFPLDVNTSTKDVFVHLKLLKYDKLTNAAILLFGKEPGKYFDQAKIKCIQIPSTQVEKPFTSYQIYDGNIFEQVDKALGFVLDAIKYPVIQQEHTAQVDRPREIPVFAIQEAIVNAVAHRDYNTTSSVQVMVFLDRVEIWNSGTLPAHLKIEDLKKPHASHPTNPLLATVMYFADYIQQAGSGTLEMLKQCKEKGLPEPEFISERNLEFKTILARDIFTEDVLRKMSLNERQLAAVKYVKEHMQITNQIYQQINKTTKRTASRDLLLLVSVGVFKKMGITGKGTVYVLRGHKGDKGDIKGTQRG